MLRAVDLTAKTVIFSCSWACCDTDKWMTQATIPRSKKNNLRDLWLTNITGFLCFFFFFQVPFTTVGNEPKCFLPTEDESNERSINKWYYCPQLWDSDFKRGRNIDPLGKDHLASLTGSQNHQGSNLLLLFINERLWSSF